MIFDSKAGDLFEQFKSADEEESVATKELSACIETPGYDDAEASKLVKAMESKHNKKMELWNKLQPFRLDSA